jgi:hypothetical protein
MQVVFLMVEVMQISLHYVALKKMQSKNKSKGWRLGMWWSALGISKMIALANQFMCHLHTLCVRGTWYALVFLL